MNLKPNFLRFALAGVLLGSLGACTVVPTYPAGYQQRPAYVETYPAYAYPGTTIYYQSGHRHYDGYGERYYGDRYYGNRYYDGPRYREMPLPPPLQLHRDVRRGLGLPRLPGMP